VVHGRRMGLRWQRSLRESMLLWGKRRRWAAGYGDAILTLVVLVGEKRVCGRKDGLSSRTITDGLGGRDVRGTSPRESACDERR